jgi:glycosyltransferase involved in cell wall biosynthesis
MLSKACLVGAYQTKLEAIARHPDVELVTIVPPSWDDPRGPVALERRFTQGYDLLVDPIRFNGHYHTYYFPTLPRRLADFRPDVVHIDEEPYNLATWLAMRQSRAAGAKTLFFSWQNLERRYPPPFNLIERQVLDGVDYAIMGNQEAVRVWQAKGYRGPQRVIPQFGVDPTLFSPPPARDPGRAFIIGSANRRLVPEKGVDLLLRAAADLPGVWRLHIAGDGPALPELRRLAAELGIAARVHFDGPLPSDQVATYLRDLDALVLTSRTLPNWKEQFGRVLVEAMACGVPVIGSRSGEIPHVIGDAGLTVPEEDIDALRNGLLQLMQDDALRQELGRRGRRRVLERYTQEQIAAETVGVYRRMLGQDENSA